MDSSRPRKMKRSTTLLIALVVTALLVGAAIMYGGPLWELFSSQERIESTVENAGPWGPLVLIALQVLQVLAAPVPGQVTSFAAGYLFGTTLGTIYAMIGATLGFTLVFVLARKLGRPFVEYFVDKKNLDKFDHLADSKGPFIFLLIFLLPFFPDDLICYVAGLTKIPIRTLIVVSVLGRLPSSLVFAFAGEGVANANIMVVLFVMAFGLVVSAAAWWKRDQLERLVNGFSRPGKPKP